MIIDAHTHIFPGPVQEDRSSYFDNEPEFKLLYDNAKSKIVTAEQLVEAMDAHRVDVSVVCGFPWRSPDHAKRNNDVVIEAVQKYPDRIIGMACFDLSWEGAADETRRCIAQGLAGAGELAFYLSGIDNDALDSLAPVMAVLKENNNLPCMIHTNEPVGHQYPGKTPVTPNQIYTLAATFPENRIILAHWGGGLFFYHMMKKQAKDVLKNIWYDTAASPFLYDPAVYDAAKSAGVLDKVLFGTDYPLLPAGRYYRDIDSSGLTPEDKKRVLGDNAQKLFYPHMDANR